MHIFPTDDEVELAADLLINKYKVSAQLLGQLFGTEERDQANSILQSLGGTRLVALDLARLLVEREGPELLAGGRKATRELRLHLLHQLSDQEVQCLFNLNPQRAGASTPRPTCGNPWRR